MRQYQINKTIHHFCNKNCYGMWQRSNPRPKKDIRIIRMCKMCNNEFKILPSDKRIFCSRGCFYRYNIGINNTAYRGGHIDYRGSNWHYQRLQQLKNDDYRCQVCLKQANSILNVHHIWPFHLFDTYEDANILANLITLCNKCHGKTEVEFNRLYPELVGNRKLPNIRISKICSVCNNVFTPIGHRSLLCDICRIRKCENCGVDFIGRIFKNRDPSFCSKICFQEHLDKTAIWTRCCKSCGIRIRSGRNRCRSCFYLHHPCRKVTDEVLELMKVRRIQGNSYTKIGKHLGLCKDTVMRYLKSYNPSCN